MKMLISLLDYVIMNPRERIKMAKKKKQVLIISSMEIWEMRKPKYDAYACGHGVHGSKKYNRRKIEREFRKEMW